jgi:3'(2'), 5'-bisphosphate nucleotidase
MDSTDIAGETHLAAGIEAEAMDALVRLAVEAGQAILSIRGAGVATEWKGDETPVTEADRRAEEIIFAGLAGALPGIAVVAEEAVAAGRAPAELTRRFALIDPLDGTREFIDGNPDFTVNIALIEDGAPIAGVVYVPMRGEVYAGSGGVAWRQAVGADGVVGPRLPIGCRSAVSGHPIVLASRSHLTSETRDFIGCIQSAETRTFGSSLKFCLLAAGEADIYPRFGKTMEWDTAAGDAVLRAAGGVTVTRDGAPLRYGKRGRADVADFANSDFIAASAAGLRLC